MLSPFDVRDMPYGRFAPPLLARLLLGKRDFDAPHRTRGVRRRLLKFFVLKAPRIWDVTYKGLKLRLYPSQNYCDFQIVMHGSHHDEPDLNAFAKVVAGSKSFVDVGANVGIYTLIASQNMAAGGTIVSFEPAPDTSEKLIKNIALNGVTAATVMRHAVGDAETTLRLHVVAANNAGCNSLSEELGLTATGGGFDVPVKTLQSALSTLGVHRIDVLKIDVEGFEDRALLPFLLTAPPSQWPEYVLLEKTHQSLWKADLITAFKERDYEVAFENIGNVHLRRRHAG